MQWFLGTLIWRLRKKWNQHQENIQHRGSTRVKLITLKLTGKSAYHNQHQAFVGSFADQNENKNICNYYDMYEQNICYPNAYLASVAVMIMTHIGHRLKTIFHYVLFILNVILMMWFVKVLFIQCVSIISMWISLGLYFQFDLTASNNVCFQW